MRRIIHLPTCNVSNQGGRKQNAQQEKEREKVQEKNKFLPYFIHDNLLTNKLRKLIKYLFGKLKLSTLNNQIIL